MKLGKEKYVQLHKKNHILILLEHTAVVENNELWK